MAEEAEAVLHHVHDQVMRDWDMGGCRVGNGEFSQGVVVDRIGSGMQHKHLNSPVLKSYWS
jgi:hypothetical protein